MKITALAGGVGGAKLAHGFAQILPPDDLTVIVNTADDFEHYGLYICPDLDTVCYTLAGLANPETGWGRSGETWNAFDNAVRLGGPGWFRLGDLDLGTHLERTRRMKAGESLTQITKVFCRAWGLENRILPMTDHPVRTIVDTDEGKLPFQEYFVRRRCEPRVKGFRFDGIERSHAAPGVLQAIRSSELVVICPSNPWVSIDPILAVPGLRSALEAKRVLAVSPIIGGKTIKGPAAKMYRELGIEPSATAVSDHYRGLLKAFVLDKTDAHLEKEIQATTVQTYATDIYMMTIADRARVAQDVLHFIGTLK
jgi:LPPG:FO 2-phospho-L-lactate transferase